VSHIIQVATKLGFEGKELVDAQEQMTALYNLFIGCDATQVIFASYPTYSHTYKDPSNITIYQF
jgi:hypothetical protein